MSAGEGPASGRGVRINRWLAERGVASRRKADELLAEGKVEINGEVAEPGARVLPGDRVTMLGEAVPEVPRLYYLFHKPKGVICTNSTREGKPRVADLVAGHVAGRVNPVGRLDEDSEGLLLLTNDGEFSNRVSHPRYGVPKTYIVKVAGALSHEDLLRLRKGVHLAEGRAVAAGVWVVKKTRTNTTLKVEMREGMNREIRRMLARVGARVVALKRVQIGGLSLKGLARGRVRALTRQEREGLLALSARGGAAPKPRSPGSRAGAPGRPG